MPGFDTRCIHGDGKLDFQDPARAISFPIYQSASFAHTEAGMRTGYDYTRQTNPTRAKLEEVMSSLEQSADTMAFSSGMAAINCLFERFRPGDHIICSEDLYGGTNRILKSVCQKNGISVTFLDTGDIGKVEEALRQETRLLYIETPTNPMMMITDIAAASALAHSRGILTAVDNTFLSPYLQNPIALGADIVVHSGTKYLGGHNDTLSGFLCVKDPGLAGEYRLLFKTLGGALMPFDSWLMLRGLKTLPLRLEKQQANAKVIAKWLQGHEKVTHVYYIGLPGHPGYETNLRQARGPGAMISFRVDSKETALEVLRKVRLITFAESLGGVESLITYPRLQTHPDLTDEEAEHLGITDTLLRLSVGAEDVEDILSDLSQALEG